MHDVLLFCACLGTCLAIFAVLQTIGLRLHHPRRILCYLLGVYLISAVVTSIISFNLFRPVFSSHSSHLVAITGALLTGFFAAGLYAFLGPATADRSCTAHLLMLLRQQADHSYGAERLISRFNGRVFMEKRFVECLGANLIQLEHGTVSLTRKGRRMADLYAAQLSGFQLEQRAEFDHSFAVTAECAGEAPELVSVH